MPLIIMLDTLRQKVHSTEGGRWAANDPGRVLRPGSFEVAAIGGVATLYQRAELQSGIRNLSDRNYVYVPGNSEEIATVT